MSREQKVAGTVYVDAGIVMIGDPCYHTGKDNERQPETWHDFCDLTTFDGPCDVPDEPYGHGLGLVFSSGYGDGAYPVIVETYDNEDGWGRRVSRIVIDFGVEDRKDEYAKLINQEDI